MRYLVFLKTSKQLERGDCPLFFRRTTAKSVHRNRLKTINKQKQNWIRESNSAVRVGFFISVIRTKFWYASSSWVITRKMELKYTVTNKLSSVLGCRTGLPCKQWLPASICLLLFVSALYTGKRKQSWMLKVERWKRSLLRKPDGQTNIIFQKNFLFVYATNTMKSESRYRLFFFYRKVF